VNEIILHHYPPSPVSEKVRVALGIKKLAWRSVEIPRVPPKPDVMPLTGGYRRTPIMQIGADIYCDSHAILRELHRRFPQPTFFPGGSEGLSWAINRWADNLFDAAAKLLIGANADQLPGEFLKDRGRLFFGPDWKVEDLKKDVPHVVAQLRGQFIWINQQLSDGRPLLLGSEPGLVDAVGYYLIWFVRGRWQGGPAMIDEFASISPWEQRVKAIGHGTPTVMTSTEAIEIARAGKTSAPERTDAMDPQGLKAGMRVSVVPDLDSGEVPVTGTLRYSTCDTMGLLRDDPRVGTVCVHFPRVGYRVTAL
jgi:glutathione S-transferase